MTPITSLIIGALESRLQQVLVANGYFTDLGARVYRGRATFDPQTETLPLSAIFRDDEEVIETQGGQHAPGNSQKLQMPFGVEAHLECDPDNPMDVANDAIADIKRAVFGVDTRLATQVKTLRYTDSVVERRLDGSPYVAVAVNGVVEFVEEIGNPSVQE